MPVATVLFALCPRDAFQILEVVVATLSDENKATNLSLRSQVFSTSSSRLMSLLSNFWGLNFVGLWSLTSNTDNGGQFFWTQAISRAAYYNGYDWKYTL